MKALNTAIQVLVWAYLTIQLVAFPFVYPDAGIHGGWYVALVVNVMMMVAVLKKL